MRHGEALHVEARGLHVEANKVYKFRVLLIHHQHFRKQFSVNIKIHFLLALELSLRGCPWRESIVILNSGDDN